MGSKADAGATRAFSELECAPFLVLTIPGVPISMARPRMSIRNGKTFVYSTQSDLKAEAQRTIKSMLPKPFARTVDGARVKIIFYMPYPASLSNKKRLALEVSKCHIKKPDIDNLAKWVLDVLNEIVYDDDSQIWQLSCIKKYDDNPRTEITIYGQNAKENRLEIS